MSVLAERLAAPAIKSLISYQSARRIGGNGRLWLNANELERDCSYDGVDQSLNRYPDFLPDELVEAYRAYSNIDCESVAVRGADEAIDLLVRAFCEPAKDRVMVCPPTYAMYDFCAEAHSVGVVSVPLKADFQLDMDGIKPDVAKTNLLFLCSPNNPTGNLIKRYDIIELLELTRESTLVVVDEAYIEFAPQHSVASLIARFPNLIVIRTLSKAFGLAAVRCGFVLADTSVMGYLKKLIAPYPIPDPSATISLAALTESGIAEMQRMTDRLVQTRDRFIERVRGLSCVEVAYVSETNFVLLRQPAGQDISLFEHLLSYGIVTRDQSNVSGLDNCVRITIGEPNSMEEVIDVLEKF